LVDQLHRHVAGGDRVALAVQADQHELSTQHPALLVDLVHGQLGALQRRPIQRRLDAGQAQSGADRDGLVFRGRPRTSGEPQAENQQDGQGSPELRLSLHVFSSLANLWLAAFFF
jgi:hypothetical protein